MIDDYTIDSLAKHPLEPAAWELPGHDCRCGEPMNETDRCCSTCRRDAAQLARDVLIPALAWARKTLGQAVTVVVLPTEQPVQTAAGAEPEEPASIYSLVETVGAISALGIALGSLAPLVALLGGA